MKSQIRAVCMLSGVVISLSLFAGVGCGQSKTPAELEDGLHDPDPAVRRHSADGLRSHDMVPAEAIPKLLAAIDKEQDPEVYGAELITLGASGAPDAKPYICKNIGGGSSGDVRMSRWANRAQMAWLKKNPGSNGCGGGASTVPEAPKSAPAGTSASEPRSM